MLAVTGFGSRIVQDLMPLLPPNEIIKTAKAAEVVDDADRYLFCAGYMAGKRPSDLTDRQAAATWAVNFLDVVLACERILAVNATARICVIGSESGIRGSYDTAYAGAKAALHNYVETAQLGPLQQLVCVSPGIIMDAGMTTRRKDVARLDARRRANPKLRFVTAAEVARLVHYLLYQDAGYITGCVVRIHGGQR